jgi:hypothetical protein
LLEFQLLMAFLMLLSSLMMLASAVVDVPSVPGVSTVFGVPAVIGIHAVVDVPAVFDVPAMFGSPTVTNIPDVARAPANVAVYHDPVVSAAVVEALAAVGVLELSAVAGVPSSITLLLLLVLFLLQTSLLLLAFRCCWRSCFCYHPVLADSPTFAVAASGSYEYCGSYCCCCPRFQI